MKDFQQKINDLMSRENHLKKFYYDKKQYIRSRIHSERLDQLEEVRAILCSCSFRGQLVPAPTFEEVQDKLKQVATEDAA